jgi:hypothetical protein
VPRIQANFSCRPKKGIKFHISKAQDMDVFFGYIQDIEIQGWGCSSRVSNASIGERNRGSAMILRRLYEWSAYLTGALALFCLVSGFIQAVTGAGAGALILGAVLALFVAISGFIIREFALSGEKKGKGYVGVAEKSQIMKAESLARKPQKVTVKS